MLISFAFDSLRSDFLQLRIFLDFNAPALVFRQMPMKTVYFKQRKDINISFDVFNWHKVTTRVQHNTTIAETRSIFHTDSRCLPSNSFYHRRTFNFSRQQLHKCLHTIEKALYCFCYYRYVLFIHFQQISFIIFDIGRWVNRKCNITFVTHLSLISGCWFNFSSEKLSDCLGVWISCSKRYSITQLEESIVLYHALRSRNHIDTLIVSLNFSLWSITWSQKTKGYSCTECS